MDTAFEKNRKNKQMMADRKEQIKKWVVLFPSLFFILEYVVFLQTKQTLLLVFNGLLILIISFYGRGTMKLNVKPVFFFLSLFVFVSINYFLIDSLNYRNLFVALYIFFIAIYTLTLKIEKYNLTFYYWVLFCKLLQLQIALTVIAYSIESIFGLHFSYGTLFLAGAILGIYLLYSIFTFFMLKKQEMTFREKQSVLESDRDLDENESENFKKLDSFFKKSEKYLDIQFSFDDLSEELDIPKGELSKLIHKVYQVNFYKFIAYKRILVALELLKELDSKTTIESVMLESGFSSKPTFNKYFKEITGVTPSEYIKR